MMHRRAILLLLLLVLATGGVAGQSLSDQVLQLLGRANTWSGTNTYQDLRLASGIPGVTTLRLYTDGTNLYWNGSAIAGGGGTTTPHNLLSTTHPDTLTAAAARGALIIGNSTPAWSRLTVGTAGQVLRTDGTDVSWSTDGSALTALNATQLTSGTIPLARISNLVDAQVASNAAIAWTKLSKTGSSLADLTTRSAADLSSGTLADARLSGNVSLFGALVDNSEITDQTITFAKWASNSCALNQVPQWNGSAWACATVTAGAGSVTSVALALPGIFTVSGSPVTSTGTLTGTLATQAPNLVWAGPTAGIIAGTPTFRSLVNADLPDSGVVPGTCNKFDVNSKGVVTSCSAGFSYTTDGTGTLPLARGGTGTGSAADDTTLVSSGSAWVVTSLPSCSTTASSLRYNSTTNLFSCGTTGGPTHALLSATHSDSVAATPVRGDLIVANSTPAWARFAVSPSSGTFLTSNGVDPTWDQAQFFTSTQSLSPLLPDANMTMTIPGVKEGAICGAYNASTPTMLIAAWVASGNTVSLQGFNGQSTDGGAITAKDLTGTVTVNCLNLAP